MKICSRLRGSWQPKRGSLRLQGKLKEALASSAERSRIQMALESQQKDQEAIGDLQGQLHAAILDAQRTETEYAVCKCRAGALR